MKKNYFFLAVVGFVLLIAILTNPDQNRHKEAVRSKFNSYVQKSVSKELSETSNEWNQAGQALGMMLGGAFIDRIIADVVTTDNYLIFSTTKITWAEESKVIGIGVFGNVFLTKKLDEALDEGLLTE